MPSGGRRVQIGDSCKDCGRIITKQVAVILGIMEYLQPRCKYCYKKNVSIRPSRSVEARAKQYIEWKFGITFDEYNRKLHNQLSGCAICKKKCTVRNRLGVDHNHSTNVIRDLLCHRCNMVLGLVEENEDLLIDLIEYLKRHSIKISA